MKRILVVGAGAVGQVYAAALQRSGADVTFFVRPKYREQVEAGLRVSQLFTLSRRRSTHVFDAPAAISSVEEAAQTPWDAVWLCIPSNGVHEQGTADLLEAVGDTLIVSLTPGLDDRAALLERVPEARLVTGLIPFLAWFEEVDVDGVEREETVVWFPPGSSCPFEGERAAEAAQAIRTGGNKAKVAPGLSRKAPFGSAFLMPMVAELESAGWAFRAMNVVHRRRLRMAVGEATRIVAAETGAPPPSALRLLVRMVQPWTLRLANLLSPVNLEEFFRKHFTKVGHQTTRSLGVYLDRARAHNVGPAPALEALLAERHRLLDESQPIVDGG